MGGNPEHPGSSQLGAGRSSSSLRGLGSGETALRSCILRFAVSGPDDARKEVDQDNSLQQTGDLCAFRSQVFMRLPVLGQEVPPCPRQQHGSTQQLYRRATQLNKLYHTALAAHNSMKVEPDFKRKRVV